MGVSSNAFRRPKQNVRVACVQKELWPTAYAVCGPLQALLRGRSMRSCCCYLLFVDRYNLFFRWLQSRPSGGEGVRRLQRKFVLCSDHKQRK